VSYRLESRFGVWGIPTGQRETSPAAQHFLAERLGQTAPRPRVPLEQVSLPEGRLGVPELTALGEVVGPQWVDTGREARIYCAVGSSMTDYVAARDGHLPLAPDAVIRPASHDEVARLLHLCSELGIAVVPFGGGTSVVGGVTPSDGGRAAVVSVLLDRMADLIEVDEVSLTARVQPGITGPVLERLLAARGLMWGHLPQSWERATVGGYIATRSAGQASTGYGRSDESVESLVVATPTGTMRLGRAPSSAAGPDLRQLLIGSEGVLGIVTEITLRVRRQPTFRHYEGLVFPDFARATAAFRALAQADLTATVMRLSDEAETEVTMAMSGPQGRAKQALQRYLQLRGIVGGGCLAILGWEGVSPKATTARRAAAWHALRAHGAVGLGTSVGEAWRRHRFEGPYLRDTLLDQGCIVETLETATEWSKLGQLHAAVTEAVTGALAGEGYRPIVFCHVSHVYGAGASLYFTAVAPAQPDRVAQWHAAKQAAGDAIMAHGGTITHHHAVGADHRPWLRAELGDLGLATLQAVKRQLDPEGIMNPGKLIP
jgi:alkyldihydroxyacetonephosphate synthase